MISTASCKDHNLAYIKFRAKIRQFTIHKSSMQKSDNLLNLEYHVKIRQFNKCGISCKKLVINYMYSSMSVISRKIKLRMMTDVVSNFLRKSATKNKH